MAVTIDKPIPPRPEAAVPIVDKGGAPTREHVNYFAALDALLREIKTKVESIP